jgi:hypothetical protein
MSFALFLMRFRRTAHIAFSRHPAARLHRAWASFTASPADQSTVGIADFLLPPLTLLMLMVFLFGSVPGASDMIAAACATACLP